MTYFLKSQSMKKLLCNLPRFVLWIAFLLIIESYVTLQAQTSSSNNSSKYQGKLSMKTGFSLLQSTVHKGFLCLFADGIGGSKQNKAEVPALSAVSGQASLPYCANSRAHGDFLL